MTDYTDQERDTLRRAAFGAMTLVSSADPGFFAMFKESVAGAKAFATAPPHVRDLLKDGMPPITKGDPAQVEASVLQALQQSVGILQAKTPQDLDAYRNVILAACAEVAGASKGVSATEQAMIGKVKAAIGSTETAPAATRTAPAAPS